MVRVSPASTSVSFATSTGARFPVVAFSFTTMVSAAATGASLLLATLMSKMSEAEALDPSVAVTLIETAPTSSFSGVPLKVRVDGLKESHDGNTVPSARVADHDKASPVFTSAKVLAGRSEEHTSELQSLTNLVCRLLLE